MRKTLTSFGPCRMDPLGSTSCCNYSKLPSRKPPCMPNFSWSMSKAYADLVAYFISSLTNLVLLRNDVYLHHAQPNQDRFHPYIRTRRFEVDISIRLIKESFTNQCQNPSIWCRETLLLPPSTGLPQVRQRRLQGLGPWV